MVYQMHIGNNRSGSTVNVWVMILPWRLKPILSVKSAESIWKLVILDCFWVNSIFSFVDSDYHYFEPLLSLPLYLLLSFQLFFFLLFSFPSFPCFSVSSLWAVYEEVLIRGSSILSFFRNLTVTYYAFICPQVISI